MADGLVHIYDLVSRWAERAPGAVAMRAGDQAWTWAELDDRVRRAAAALRAAGIGPGDRIATLDRNHPVCLELTLAASLVGAANAVVNFRLAPDEVRYVLSDSRAKHAIVGAGYASLVTGLRDSGALDTLRQLIVLGGEHDEYEDWIAARKPLADAGRYPAGPGDCFLQLYTSGTTGWPKGAMLTHLGVGAHTVICAASYFMDQTTVNLVAMPLFHVGGTCWALASMYGGGQTIVVRDLVPGPVLDLMAQRRVTHAFFVPAVLGPLLADPGYARAGMASVRVLGYGGSPMPLQLLRRVLAELPGTGLYSVYGMTEMSGVFCVLGAAEHRDPSRPHLLSAVGKPLAGTEVRVVDPATGADVPTGELGEFWVRSAQAMAGYWGNPGATAETITPDGWLRTGDVGLVDGDGYLYLRDRVKDMIISGGENVYPAEVERVLAEHPGVAEVAVVGAPDERWGETPVAFVVAAARAEVDGAGLIAFARERLAHYKCPAAVVVVPSLPRNPTGKILKRELRDQVPGAAGGGPDS